MPCLNFPVVTFFSAPAKRGVKLNLGVSKVLARKNLRTAKLRPPWRFCQIRFLLFSPLQFIAIYRRRAIGAEAGGAAEPGSSGPRQNNPSWTSEGKHKIVPTLNLELS